MLCEYCKSARINPEDSLAFKTANHINIKLNNDKIIHVLHLNAKNSSSILTYQPGGSNFRQDYIRQSNTCFENENLPYFENFTQLIDSIENKRVSKNKSYIICNAKESLGLSIVYGNKKKNDFIRDVTIPQVESTQELPTIFFIHGVGGSYKIWMNQLNYFGDLGFEIIAIDLIGHGESSKTKSLNNYDFLEMCSDVLNVFDSFSKSENVVVGHSYGCSFACYLSQIREDRIKKLVLISGGLPYPLSNFIIFVI